MDTVHASAPTVFAGADYNRRGYLVDGMLVVDAIEAQCAIVLLADRGLLAGRGSCSAWREPATCVSRYSVPSHGYGTSCA